MSMYLKVREIGEKPECRVNWWIWEVTRVHWEEYANSDAIQEMDMRCYTMPDETGRLKVRVVAQLSKGQDIIVNIGTQAYILGANGQTIDRIPN